MNNKYPKVPIAIAPTIPKSTFWFLATHSSVLEAFSSKVLKTSAVVLSCTSTASTSSNSFSTLASSGFGGSYPLLLYVAIYIKFNEMKKYNCY